MLAMWNAVGSQDADGSPSQPVHRGKSTPQRPSRPEFWRRASHPAAVLAMPKTVQHRLNAFRKRTKVTRTQLADAFSTPPRTFNGWLYGEHTPPGPMVTLLDLIEANSQVRSQLGLSSRKERPRGRPFPKGHKFRFNDPRRPQALAEARAKRKAKD